MEFAVIPGFYGKRADGVINTFSRGGSDITGLIVAKAVKADLYENWTDVSGFLVTDPRIIANPETIGTITYKELRELSYMGATVLHEDAIFPLRSAESGSISAIPTVRRTADNDRGEHLQQNQSIQSPESLAKGFASINIEKI